MWIVDAPNADGVEVIFFFSSRRRHTRCSRDWSSDVCSSDLVRIVNGVVQTGLNVARYDDGTTIADKPLRMRGTVTDAIITGGSAVLAVDAESRTFVNVLDVATATLRLKKDVKIKGHLDYADLSPSGLLYISHPD